MTHANYSTQAIDEITFHYMYNIVTTFITITIVSLSTFVFLSYYFRGSHRFIYFLYLGLFFVILKLTRCSIIHIQLKRQRSGGILSASVSRTTSNADTNYNNLIYRD